MRDFLWRLAIRWQIFWMEMDDLGREVLANLRNPNP